MSQKERGDHRYQHAVSDCTLPCSEEKLGKYFSSHLLAVVKYLETHFCCRSFISTPSQFRKGLQRFFQSLIMSLKKICFMQIHKPGLNRGLCRHHWSLYPHLLKLYNCDNRTALCRYYDILPIAPTAICLLDTNAYLLSKQSCIVSSHCKYYINDPDQALSHWQWKICPI